MISLHRQRRCPGVYLFAAILISGLVKRMCRTAVLVRSIGG